MPMSDEKLNELERQFRNCAAVDPAYNDELALLAEVRELRKYATNYEFDNLSTQVITLRAQLDEAVNVLHWLDEGLRNRVRNDYHGGYSTTGALDVFRHGMDTVCNVVSAQVRELLTRLLPTGEK